MCMKINELSSHLKSNIGVEAGARDRSGLVPSVASTIRRRARRAQLGVAPLPVGGPGRTPCVEAEGRKVARGERPSPRDVKNEATSGDVHENKRTDDYLPDTKDDISARLHATLHKITRILQEPSAHLSLLERWRTNRSPQNVETREAVIWPAFHRQSPDEPMDRWPNPSGGEESLRCLIMII
jgi:hypothetical protein